MPLPIVSVTVIAGPVTEPLTLAEAKEHLRVDFNDDDNLITGLIAAARAWAEEHQNRAYITQMVELTIDSWPEDGVIRLPMAPLQAVSAVSYLDKDGNEVIWAPANYVVDSRSTPGRLAPGRDQSWPDAELYPVGAIRIRYTAGYGDASKVPVTVKRALLLLIGHWYENREAVQTASGRGEGLPIPFGVESLLAQGMVY